MPTKICLGDLCKDRITGLEGVVVGITEWLHGCRRIVIQPKELKDGKPVDTSCFDEPQLTRIGGNVFVRNTSTGGPGPNAERRGTPAKR